MAKARLVTAVLVMALASWTLEGRARQLPQTRDHITRISVCGAGPAPSDANSCPDGTLDTQDSVVAAGTGGTSLNQWFLPNAVDEHSSVFPPGALGSNADYVFFLASGTNPDFAGDAQFVHSSTDIGVVVLSGRPGADGRWRLTFAPGYGSFYGETGENVGQVFLAPTGEGQNRCPDRIDHTFDLNYAAPGSVVADPTVPGSLLMFYEGVNSCEPSGTSFRLGIATSSDAGHSWPSYAPNDDYAFPLLPFQNTTQGPHVSDAGAFGTRVCLGAASVEDCGTPKPYPGYGRYPVIEAPPSGGLHDSQPAAFVDNVQSGSPVFLYTVQAMDTAHPLTTDGGANITIARAPLNEGSGRLLFEKWNGQPCDDTSTPCWTLPASDQTINDNDEYPLLPHQTFEHCGDPSQSRTSPSISYFASTEEYVLTFVCLSSGNPKDGGLGGPRGAAWFFSTSRDLSDPNAWGTPHEILGSWNVFPDDDDPLYNGWYPTFMSLTQEPSRLTARGFVFYLLGRTGGGCDPSAGCHQREFSSRRFTIQTTDNVYSRAPIATITGHSQPLHPNGLTTFTFKSDEPGSAFECSLNGGRYSPCTSPASVDLAEGLNTFAARAISPFGLKSDAAESRVPFNPVLRR